MLRQYSKNPGGRRKTISVACLIFVLFPLSWAAAQEDEALHLKFDNSYADLPEMAAASSAPVAAQSLEAAAPAPVAVSRAQTIKGSMTVGLALVQVDNPSFQFGKFTGVTDDTVYLIGAADVRSNSGKRYWNLKADDLALDNRMFTLNAGTLGKYKLHFGYSELDDLISNNSQTHFYGAGGATLTLPPGFVKGKDTPNMTTLAANMKNVDIGTKRKEGDVSFSYATAQNVELSFSFRRYLKNGIKSMGAVVFSDDDGPQGLVIPEPVDYHTDELRTGLDWQGVP